MSAASVRDANYRDSLAYRHIYINREDPPVELMRRAHKIISRPRTSPEIDDQTAQQLIKTSRRIKNDSEEVIVQQLAPDIIPAMKLVPDQRLTSNANQLWSDSVPVPLDPDVLTTPLPLPKPKPKPDLAFGYSEAAFNRKQIMTIELPVDGQFGRSYAIQTKSFDFRSWTSNLSHKQRMELTTLQQIRLPVLVPLS